MSMSYCIVNDYWDKERGWKWDLINEILPYHILNRMVTILIREEEEAVDEIHWEPSDMWVPWLFAQYLHSEGLDGSKPTRGPSIPTRAWI